MRRNCALAALVMGWSLSSAVSWSQAPAPTQPAPPPPAAAPPSTTAPPTPSAPPRPAAAPEVLGGPDRVDPRQGIVRLERGGRVLGLGAVLRADGRILTALSILGHGNYLLARFSDDTVLPVRVVAGERAWDLALLATEGGHWTEGLRASTLELADKATSLRRFRARAGRLDEATITVEGQASLLGRDGGLLDGALVLKEWVGEDEVGTPLFDARGEVVAVIGTACAPASAQNCQLSPFGAPVSAIKQFLRKAPPREPAPTVRLGFRGVAGHTGSIAGVRIVSVEQGSPGALAGLRAEGSRRQPGVSRSSNDGAGDLVVAVDDVPVTTPEEMTDAIQRAVLVRPARSRRADGGVPEKTQSAVTRAPATPASGPSDPSDTERSVRLLVYGSGKFREVTLSLQAPKQLPAASSPGTARRAAPPAAVVGKPAAPAAVGKPAVPAVGKGTPPVVGKVVGKDAPPAAGQGQAPSGSQPTPPQSN